MDAFSLGDGVVPPATSLVCISLNISGLVYSVLICWLARYPYNILKFFIKMEYMKLVLSLCTQCLESVCIPMGTLNGSYITIRDDLGPRGCLTQAECLIVSQAGCADQFCGSNLAGNTNSVVAAAMRLTTVPGTITSKICIICNINTYHKLYNV